MQKNNQIIKKIFLFTFVQNNKKKMIKKLLFLIIPLFIISCKVQRVPQSNSNKSNNYISVYRNEYIQSYKDLAIKEMNRSGVPASITLAQAMLESDNGNSTLAKKANNHFGIKCHNSWKGKKVYHDDDRRGECFRKYNSVYNSYKDHSDFIANGNRYQFLFDYKSTDYKSWAKGLQKAGYATSKTYSTLLIKIIEDNQLYLYDQGKSREYTIPEEYATDTQGVALGDVDNFTINLNKHQVYNKNRVDYIITKKGDTYESITEEFGMLLWELFKYNELDKNEKISDGVILYLQPKRNKAWHKSEFHVVKAGETMYTISQMYGVKVNKLYEKNLIEKGTSIKVDQKLWLRDIKPHSEAVKESQIISEFDE